MVNIIDVYSSLSDYLDNNQEIRNDLKNFEKAYDVNCYEQAKALCLLALNKQGITNPNLFANLKEYYNDVDPAFKNIIDKCFSFIFRKYAREMVQLKDGTIVSGKDYILKAWGSLKE